MSHKLIVIILLLIILGCASVSNPIGGEKDTENPILVSSRPKDQTIKFNDKEIILEFSEWIKVEQIEKKLIITPRTDIKYEAANRKTQLKLTFKEALADSTTYTLNFRDAITDITEGNVWLNSKIAFSTGDYLDSMSVNGSITNLFTNKPAKDYTVGLYPVEIDTSNLRQGLPIYIASTDKSGKFSISNVKVGNYLIYAFNDKNENLINNSSDEAFAFHTKIVNLKDSIKNIDMQAYFSNEDTLKVKNIGPSGRHFKVSINKPIANYSLNVLEDQKKFIYSSLGNEFTDIIIYKENFQDLINDSIQIYANIIDSVGQQIKDTFYISFRESKIESDLIKIVDKPTTEIISDQQKFSIGFNKPIFKINYDSLFFSLGDSIKLKEIRKEDITYNQYRDRLIINSTLNKYRIDSLIAYYQSQEIIETADSTSTSDTANVKMEIKKNTSPKKIYNPKLVIKKGAFVGIENDTVDTKEYGITFKKIEDYGSIQGKVQSHNKITNYIIELLKENYELVDSIQTEEEFKFTYVQPGKYRIRVIEDLNNNHKWDRGNPLLLTPYEYIIHYNEVIVVKANWEIQDIKIDLKNG